ncbi:BTAD domain-containing putative transcriptional regulator [Actinoplanes sp. NBRC 103695]|uniref:AfsR/SARP family transcriptional regulator n=1 Tax=Actinoplanes sp. NBRC 103695 TaxID=3032202 RepID=UPI0024A3395E|nr:BTAD domain-containing putative transcriptional regulator [Actinoplanes sp. NBRC 103695]GLY97614.1 hypothetical protein Acsp02_48680 [Actinoplanes sp. NBRC 103695]
MLIRTLGPIELHTPTAVHQLGAGKPAAVLATLVQQPNAWVTVDQLAEATWPGAAMPASAAANLKTYVWQLRRLLGGADRITRRADAYRLRVLPGELDADQARSLAAAARTADPSTAADLIREALALWRGRPYSGVESAATAADVLEELRLELSERLAALRLELGDTAEAIGTLRGVVAEAPLREPAWALLVRALHTAGQRTEALLASRRAAAILRTELGVAPGPQLTAYSASFPAAPSLVRRELPRDVRLVGRAAELAHISRAAAGPAPIVLLSGPAGIGKTALAVHAAHRLAADFPDGQFFIHLRQPAGALLERLLRGLGLRPCDIPADLDERAALWRSEVSRRRVLLVLDDAQTREQVWPLLPATSGSMALVTARSLTGHLDGATHLPLGPAGMRPLTGRPAVRRAPLRNTPTNPALHRRAAV